MFGMRCGFGRAIGLGNTRAPVAPAPTARAPIAPACKVPATPPPSSVPPAVGTRVVDSVYSAIPGGEVSYFQREARVPFSVDAHLDNAAGTILAFKVPDAQTLLISDVEFYAQGPNPQLAGDQLPIAERRLAGYVTLHLLVDDRVPMDLGASIDPPAGSIDQTELQASAFNRLGVVLGGAERQPQMIVRAREGQTVRLAFHVARAPAIPVDHVGAVLKGYVVPTAILTAKVSG